MKHQFFHLLAILLLPSVVVEATPDLKSYFAVPNAKELPLEKKVLSETLKDGVKTQAVTFRGADFNGKPTKIFAWYSRPAKEGKYPAVLQIHGAGLTTLDPNPDYAKNGFACLALLHTCTGTSNTRITYLTASLHRTSMQVREY